MILIQCNGYLLYKLRQTLNASLETQITSEIGED